MDNEATSTEVTEETTLLNEELSAEVTELEPSEEEAVEQVTSDDQDIDQEPETLYAGKYQSVEALEKAYNESNAGGKDMANKLKALESEIDSLKMTPEERSAHEQNRTFIKQNNLMTKQEFMQMQKDEREAGELISSGATKHQIDRVKEVANFGTFAKMSLTEVYRSLYGVVPKRKPKQGVGSRAKARTVKSKQYTKAQIDGMTQAELKENYADILAKGVAG